MKTCVSEKKTFLKGISKDVVKYLAPTYHVMFMQIS